MKPLHRSQRRGPVVGGLRPRNTKDAIYERQVALIVNAEEELAEEEVKKEDKD